MISNVQTEDDLVELALVDIEASIAKGSWQLAHELAEVLRRHVVLTALVEFLPGVQERLNITFLK